MNLNRIKQEGTEKLRRETNLDGDIDFTDAKKCLEETLDRLVDEIEKAVVPEFSEHDGSSLSVEVAALNAERKRMREAFTRFKGESECGVGRSYLHRDDGKGNCEKCGACLLTSGESL